MPNRKRDWSGSRFDRLVAVRQGGPEPQYWIFRCDCGLEISRVPHNVRKNKYNACSTCHTGSSSWAWAGVGKIPKDYFNTIVHGADARGFEFNVTMGYLWSLYTDQGGRCAFTGWPLTFHATYRAKKTKTASLDRIDSSLGYIEGNLQWVHRDVNRLKKNMSDERFLELCSAIHNHQEKIKADDHR